MMATPTYELIEERVLTGTSASETFGNGGTLTQAYKDIIVEVITFSSDQNQRIRFNGDTGSNYSTTILTGNGSTATSSRETNSTFAWIDYTSGTSATVPDVATLQIMSYSSSSTYKTLLTRAGRGPVETNNYVGAFVSLWRSTAAITSMTLSPSQGSWASGSTFRLWGVKG